MTRAELLALVRATGCAREIGDTVFLCDPDWSDADRKAFARLSEGLKRTEDRRQRTEDGRQKTENTNPSVLNAASSVLRSPSSDLSPPSSPSAPRAEGWLCVRTGGSSGGIKFARHDEHTLTAAVEGFRAHFGLQRVNAVDVLPAYHVSGLMARVRCAATGGTHQAWAWKRLEAGEFPNPPNPAVISLVPTQLQRLLASPAATEWLRKFAVIFLGGGPTWPELANAASQAGLNVALSYGMTETAAMVTALKPEEFLAGARSCGRALPHTRVSVNDEGRIVVGGDSLFRGYIGGPEQRGDFITHDLGRLDERGHLHILGRADAVIITGGKKVHPAEVEATLRASGEFEDIAVLGVPDPEWGEAVIACYPASAARKPNEARAVEKLAPHQRPKRFVPVPDWPRNAQGKVNRAQLREACLRQSP